jgi:hypothetical protein
VKKKIVFLLGSANMSGGTYVIFQHALYLQTMGYDVTIALVFMQQNDFISLKNSSTCWHEAIQKLHFIQITEASQYQYDVAIFTWWATMFYLEKMQASAYIYFVQSIESRFYDNSLSFLQELVGKTYKIGLPVITEATWIKNYLTHHYRNNCLLVKNGILKSLYVDKGEVIAEKCIHSLRILVEGPIEPHYKNIAKTIKLCGLANVGEIWLLTSSDVQAYEGVARVFSRVPIYDVPKIYRSCDVLVKLSYVEGMFGPPLEIFHCGGTAIVYDVTGHDEYIVHDVNALVAKTDDDAAVVHYLQLLNQDRDLLTRLQQGAKQTAEAWVDWDASSLQFASAIESHSLNALTDASKISIRSATQLYFYEHLPIMVWRGGVSETRHIVAEPQYQNTGEYLLTIAIEKNVNQFLIMLGEEYQQVMLINLQLIKFNKQTLETTIENLPNFLKVSTNQMRVMNNSGLYGCLGSSSGVAVSVHNTAIHQTDYQFCFQLKFMPVTVGSAILIKVDND